MATDKSKRNTDPKTWHINFEYQDSDTPSSIKKTSVRVQNKKISLWQAAVSAFILLHAIFPSTSQAADFWSFFKLDEANAQESSELSLLNYSLSSSYNLQNTPLLSPSRKAELSYYVGGADLNIVDGAVMVAAKGPVASKISRNDVRKKADNAVKIYEVQKGDTLSEIAEKFGVSQNTIRWANGLGRDGLIKVGQKLVILPVDGVKYKVKYGGTLRDVIKKIGGDVEGAATLNGIDPDTELEAGTEVIIPGAHLKETQATANKFKKYIRSYGKGAPVYKGYFMRPVRGGVRTQGLHGRNAVDIASVYGAAIYAAASGQVVTSKWGAWNGGYGNYIKIRHPNGSYTLYAHLSKNFVKKGDYVKQGQIIGAMGSSGKSTGVHLHFEVRGARNPF